MNILPCPFCGAPAQKPPWSGDCHRVITHTELCPLFLFEMITETRFWEDNKVKIQAWNSRLLQFPQSDSDGYLQVAPTGHLAHRGDSLPLETPSSLSSTGDKLESAPPLGSQPLPQTAPE